LEKVRDLLVIIVCSGMIVWWGVRFVTQWNQQALEENVIVQQAEDDCRLEGMTCQFTTVKSAEDYLKHVRDQREDMRKLKDAYGACMKKATTTRQEEDCAVFNPDHY
jgi:hypothetical protein